MFPNETIEQRGVSRREFLKKASLAAGVAAAAVIGVSRQSSSKTEGKQNKPLTEPERTAESAYIKKTPLAYEARLKKFDGKTMMEPGFLLGNLRYSLFEEPVPQEISSENKTFETLMKEKGVSIKAYSRDIYPLRPGAGRIYENDNRKTYFLPDISNEKNILPEEYWHKKNDIKWHFEVVLENEDKTKNEILAADYMTMTQEGNHAIWVFTPVKTNENGEEKQFIR